MCSRFMGVRGMAQSDYEYFQMRAAQERELAASADKANVAAIHAELARGYQALAEQEELRPGFRIAPGRASAEG